MCQILSKITLSWTKASKIQQMKIKNNNPTKIITKGSQESILVIFVYIHLKIKKKRYHQLLGQRPKQNKTKLTNF